MTSDKFVTQADIARILGVTRQRVSVIVAKDGFPAPKVFLSHTRLWAREDVEVWVAENRAVDPVG